LISLIKPLGESNIKAPLLFSPLVLKYLIKKLKPDLIHSMEFQHSDYLTLKTKELFHKNTFPKWIATNWGSDIYYYKQFVDHKKQISRLLKNIDYYSCECCRDLKMASDLGFEGKAMPVFPNTGGIDITIASSLRQKHLVSSRRIIMVKGYQHFAGRALIALDAIQACSDLLIGYNVIIYSATSPEVIQRVKSLKNTYGINCRVLPYSRQSDIMELFSRSRIYLGVSISDAISTSMLEAMSMGAFPIQTNTSCCEEWIKDGKTGFIIPPDDIDEIVKKLRIAIINDQLVNVASKENWQVIQKRFDKKILKSKEIDFYNSIFKDMKNII